MTEKEWLQRIEELEREQREHYAASRQTSGDAVGELICNLVSEGRAKGFSLPGGPPADRADGSSS